MSEIYRPFEIDLAVPVTEPPDLVPHLIAAEGVVRFDSRVFLPGLFVDNTRRHTNAVAQIAGSLWPTRSRLQRMCWLHDLPESYVYGGVDISVVDKSFMPLNDLNGINMGELQAAQRIFTPRDIQIYQDFQNAEQFLRGHGPVGAFSNDGIDANVIDSGEGNMFVHFNLSRWARNSYDPDYYDHIRPTLRHAFLQYKQFTARLDYLEQWSKDASDAKFLLDLQMRCIKGFWEGLGDRIPQEVVENLFVS